VQLRKTSVSIPSTIAEGHARRHSSDYANYVSWARASVAELETQLQVAREEDYISEAEYREITSLAAEVGKMLTTLLKRLDG
jgi:four helix bundle protein